MQNSNELQIKFTGQEPLFMSDGACGADLRTAEETTIKVGEVVLVKTGTFVEFPKGYAMLALPRSSLATKHSLRLANSVGLVDVDYRGEIMFAYENKGGRDVTIPKGERIGQILIVVSPAVQYVRSDKLSDTDRGEGGFGSTGSGNATL